MELLDCGKIVGTHGIKGELKINPWCDGPDFLLDFEDIYLKDGTCLEIEKAYVHKNCVNIKIAGIDTIEAAMPLINKIVYINKAEALLPEGTFFIADLIGLCVKDADTGELYGTVSDVLNTGANDIYSVTKPTGGELLVPAINEVIVNTDLTEGVILIRPLEGLFSDEV